MELNLSRRLAGDVGVGQQTARRWLNVLEIGYLAVTLPPHYANFRKRLRKRPRLHFLDTGLVCYLLDIPDAHTLARHPLRGAIFESFVVSELIKSFANRRREAPIYFWRDATGREIDALIDLGGRLVPVEVKSGETVPADAVQNLEWWTLGVPALLKDFRACRRASERGMGVEDRAAWASERWIEPLGEVGHWLNGCLGCARNGGNGIWA